VKKKIVLYSLLAAVIVGGILFIKNVFVKDILLLKNGTIIATENTWELGTNVLYMDGQEISYVEQEAVEQIYAKGFHGFHNFKKRSRYYLTAVRKELVALIRLESIQAFLSEHGKKIGLKRTPLWVIILLSLAVCGTVPFLIRQYLKIRKSVEVQVPVTDTTDLVQPALTSIQTVKNFFLNLFRQQLGETEEAPGKIVPISGRSSDSMQVYELKIKQKDEWKSRRMAISPLGEGTGSKSQCFYVIYDTHIVVKIPPSPIIDFADYIRRIWEETAIVAKLSPMECIIPSISVILKKIKTFPDGSDLDPETLEKKYASWLEANPQFQNHLKVGDAFVFFMDLSRYYFLSHVMGGLHDMESEIHNEIVADSDVVQDYQGFENKYGQYGGAACMGLQNLYVQFDKEVNQLSTMSGRTISMGETQKRMLFLTRMADREYAENYRGLPDQQVEQVNRLLNKITAENTDVSKTYMKLLKQGIRKRMFNRNKVQMESIISNLLILLAMMGEKKVAMRDLKPDNLLVAGDPAKYPSFLSSTDEYSIGLIDVETAVKFEIKENGKPGQPQLGGTPFYATPSHFVTNGILNKVYADLPQILLLQDWYALVGIIYELETGKRLFIKTAIKIHAFMQTLHRSLAEKRNIPEVYKELSYTFWKTAKEEFDAKVNKSESMLKALKIVIPEQLQQRFKTYLREKKHESDSRIKAFIQSQTHFQTQKNRQSLLCCSYEAVCRLKAKYQQPEQTGKIADGKIPPTFQLLEDLAILKMESEKLAKMIQTLDADVPGVSVYDVLVIMFGIVVDAMYQTEWEALSAAPDAIEATEKPCEPEVSEEVVSGLGYTLTVQAPS